MKHQFSVQEEIVLTVVTGKVCYVLQSLAVGFVGDHGGATAAFCAVYIGMVTDDCFVAFIA
jgi:hypothetical protein